MPATAAALCSRLSVHNYAVLRTPQLRLQSGQQQPGRARACQASVSTVADWGSTMEQSQTPSSSEMWDMGFADCEADSCGLVPDGSLVLVPIGPAPAAREDRITLLEQGVRLDENTATVVGAVGSKKVNFVLDLPVVSAQHARIEGVLDESSPKWSIFGRPQSKVKYYVTDLKSKNGSFLNRGRLRPLMPVEIKPGDTVAFGVMTNAYRVVQAWARKDYKW